MQISKKATELRKKINEHNIHYYVYDSPIISDSEYDKLLKELIELEEKHPFIVTPDSPTQRVGATPLKKFKTIKHSIPMLSLANAMDDKEIIDFNKQIKKNLNDDDQIEYICEPKLDGLAVELVYDNGIFTKGSTRGDGITGEDITQNLKSIKSIPLRLNDSKPPEKAEIRGEVFIDHTDFKVLNKSQLKKGKQPFANPRNCAAGSLRQLDPKIAANRPLKINCYAAGVIKGNEFDNHFEFLQKLPIWGFPVNNLIEKGYGSEFLIQYKNKIENLRNSLEYDIDGVVFKVNCLKKQQALGNRSKNPRWAFAGKFKSIQVTTVINNIISSVGRTGAITPVAQLEAVNIGGVIVKNATLHNQDEIDKKDIRIGDTVIIQRAGEVIPEVVKVILEKRSPNLKKYKIPKNCPKCNFKVVRKENESVVRCQNYSCPDQIKGRLNHFVSKSCMNIDGFGEKLVNQLVEKKKVKNFSDIFKLKINDIKYLDRQGDKSAKNIIESINRSKNTNLYRFINGLGIKNVGEQASKLLEKNFKSLNNLFNATFNDFVKIHEIGDVMANSLHDFFTSKENKILINNCIFYGLNFESKIEKKSNNLENIIFVFTGSLTEIKRSEAKKLVEKHNGKVSSSVSKNTNFLVAGKNSGSKLVKARKIGIKIISESDFIKMVY